MAATVCNSHWRPTNLVPDQPMMPGCANRQQPTRTHRFVGALDVNQLRLTESCCVIDKSCGGRAEHHATRRSDRFHPLGHTDLLTDGGVTVSPGTDLTRNYLTGVKTDAQLEIHAVAVLNFDGKPLCLLLNTQGSQTGTNSVVLQRRRRTEHRHDPVAGELVHRAPVPLHHRRRPVYQVGHDLAQPLRTHGRRDVH